MAGSELTKLAYAIRYTTYSNYGLYNYNDKSYIFVSTGIGTALPPMRFLSDKMIGIINIKGKSM